MVERAAVSRFLEAHVYAALFILHYIYIYIILNYCFFSTSFADLIDLLVVEYSGG